MYINNYMSYIKISQAAKLLEVNTRTLMRWDKEGKFPAHKETLSKMRFYDETEVLNHVFWFKLRRKHKDHVKKLGAIRAEVNKYVSTQPLQVGGNPKFHKFEDMKKAFVALNIWEKEHKEILKEYSQLPPGFKAKVDP